MDDFSEVNGKPYHPENPSDILSSELSFPGQALRAQTAPIAILTLAEAHFMRAEAAARGWTSEDAANQYRAGIKASWKQWSVFDQDHFDSYMNRAEVAFDFISWKEQIGFQKWIAYYGQGYEAWAEWRRLDLPALRSPQYMFGTEGKIPLRHSYPSSEAELNKASYEEALKAQGNDDALTSVWWDQ